MRVWIPITALGLLATALLFAKQSGAPAQGEKAAEPPRLLIDINRASSEDFAKLPGIGPKLAERIVKFRDKHGPFRRVEDLLAIRGIGSKKWKMIRPYLRVGKTVPRESRR